MLPKPVRCTESTRSGRALHSCGCRGVYYHRMAGFGKDLKDLAPTPCHGQGHYSRLVRAPSKLALNTYRARGNHNISGQPVQCLTICTIEKFFLISNLNLLSFMFCTEIGISVVCSILQ